VLVTADGPYLRDPVAAIRGLAAAGYRSGLAVSSGSSLATASRFCGRRVDVPGCREPDYRQAIDDAVRTGGYLTVIPTSEAARHGIGVTVPELLDKTKMAARAEQVGIPSPPTRVIGTRKELLAAAAELEYPVIVKPSVHTFTASWVDSPRSLATIEVDDGPVVVQPFLQGLNAITGVTWKGRLVAAVHERWLRIWPYRCGVASAAVTIRPDEEREARVVRLLEGYEGCFQAQFAGPYLLDVNLQVGSTHPLAVAAGVNLAGIYCDLVRGESLKEVRGRSGVFFRWLEGDFRSLITSVRVGEASPAAALRELRPRIGAAHSTESLTDPGPMLRRLAYIARSALRGRSRVGAGSHAAEGAEASVDGYHDSVDEA
jgi:hypothetical protein